MSQKQQLSTEIFFSAKKKVPMWKSLVFQQGEYKLSCKNANMEILSITSAQADVDGSNYDCTNGDQQAEAINLD